MSATDRIAGLRLRPKYVMGTFFHSVFCKDPSEWNPAKGFGYPSNFTIYDADDSKSSDFVPSNHVMIKVLPKQTLPDSERKKIRLISFGQCLSQNDHFVQADDEAQPD